MYVVQPRPNGVEPLLLACTPVSTFIDPRLPLALALAQ